MTEEEETFEDTMQKLFTAKWNIPQATAALGKSANQENWEEVKGTFSQYCSSHPLTHNKF
jgi:hypothetical protein